MGTSLFGPLPRTRSWIEVAGLLAAGSDACDVAQAALGAAATSIRRAATDPVFAKCTWVLMQLPQAAKATSFAAGLRQMGVKAEEPVTIARLATAVDDVIDEINRVSLRKRSADS